MQAYSEYLAGLIDCMEHTIFYQSIHSLHSKRMIYNIHMSFLQQNRGLQNFLDKDADDCLF